MSYTVHINPDDPKSIDAALRTEWLLTNGLGGYAMGTVLGVNTRRYHGLLVAATTPPVGRIVALHSIIEQLIVPRDDGTEEVIDLSTQQFVGGDGEPMLHPNGWRSLRRFECDARQAVWTWTHAEVLVRRTIQAALLSQRTRILYQVQSGELPWRLRVRPFLSFRDFHSLAHAHSDGDQPEIAAFLNVSHNSDRWIYDSQTWNRFAYITDRDRGQDWVEDTLWSPYFWEFVQGNPEAPAITFSLRALDFEAPKQSPAVAPWAHVQEQEHESVGLIERLSGAASQFVVQRWLADSTTASVIAGYPWFGDWGRDTMIALPGLMLCTGRLDEARSTLKCFAKHLRNGLIPNLFDDYGGAAHYNTVDASLWFVHAAHALWSASRSPKVRGEPSLLAACREIIAAYRRGTDFNIRMDDDGLILAGDPTTQLTWMDAKRDGVVFTPRHGKAVEINALWHNALLCLSEMSDDPNERNELMMLARRVAASFRSAFWWAERQCLHDCLSALTGADGKFLPDGRLRPNQVFAVSLPFSPLNESQQRAVLKVVGERLLTPFGLRTLDREDPNYNSRYEGDPFQRDAAYHNGTVWPWLIGAYCEALLRVENFNAESTKRVRDLLKPLIDEMNNATGGRCLGQIAEVYDGDPPHRPSGCPAQAWSVAEVLRVLAIVS